VFFRVRRHVISSPFISILFYGELAVLVGCRFDIFVATIWKDLPVILNLYSQLFHWDHIARPLNLLQQYLLVKTVSVGVLVE
jgi:hypothetical protein